MAARTRLSLAYLCDAQQRQNCRGTGPGDGCCALTEFESLAHLGLKSIHCECFSLVVSSPGPARCSRGGSLIAAQATPGPASGPGQDGRPITVVPLSWGCRPSWRESESCDTHWQSVTASLRLPPAHPPSHTLRLASLVQVPLIRVFSKRVQQTLNSPERNPKLR